MITIALNPIEHVVANTQKQAKSTKHMTTTFCMYGVIRMNDQFKVRLN